MLSEISITCARIDLAAKSSLWFVAVERVVCKLRIDFGKVARFYTKSTPALLLNKLSYGFLNKLFPAFKQLFGGNTQPKSTNLPLLSFPFSPLSPGPINTNNLYKV
jgi:hypothetical protein